MIRRFLCNPLDIEKVANNYKEDARKAGITIQAQYFKSVVLVLSWLTDAEINPDDSTIEQYSVFKENPSDLNFHLVTHHVFAQLVESYDNGNRKGLCSLGFIYYARKHTENCIKG